MQETNEVAACCDTTSPKHEKRKIPLVVFCLLVDSLRVTLPPIHTASTQQLMLHTLMGAIRGHLSCSITFSWDLETNQCQGFKPHTRLPANLNLELDIFLERTHRTTPHALSLLFLSLLLLVWRSSMSRSHEITFLSL